MEYVKVERYVESMSCFILTSRSTCIMHYLQKLIMHLCDVIIAFYGCIDEQLL